MGNSQNFIKNILMAVSAGFLLGTFLILEPIKKVEAELTIDDFKEAIGELGERLVFIQRNSLLAVSNPVNPEPKVSRKIKMVVTGYSSTIDQTDSDPFITAAGTLVREGIVATNMLNFGTRIKMPELFGNKIFVVEDRMHPTKKYHLDIWFSETEQALGFGAKTTYVEILEN